MTSPFVTRFAPSPTGRLHLGHAFSALTAWRRARAEGGRFLLRIEDIDPARCRPEFEVGIYEDLAWLGLEWEEPVRRQSRYIDHYETALGKLHSLDVLYPCFCTRREIAEEIARSPSAPHGPVGPAGPSGSNGPDGPRYPGTCRALSERRRAELTAAGHPYALRLDMAHAIAVCEAAGRWPLDWHDEIRGPQRARPEVFGDVVLARKDAPTSYHLAVTTDDALQGVSHVIRGEDLFEATHIHRLLQALLDLPTPVYHHHRLLTDASGRRFAKRDRAETLEARRQAGETPEALIALLSGEP